MADAQTAGSDAGSAADATVAKPAAETVHTTPAGLTGNVQRGAGLDGTAPVPPSHADALTDAVHQQGNEAEAVDNKVDRAVVLMNVKAAVGLVAPWA